MNKIAVTGATGFLGRAIVYALSNKNFDVRAISRSIIRPSFIGKENINFLTVGSIDSKTEWSTALTGVDCIIHCASLNHTITNNDPVWISACNTVNVDGTRRLAEQAIAANVRRLIFLSSVKVNGEQSQPGKPFSFSDHADPFDLYGASKWKAEQALWETAANDRLEVVVIRLPIVYGFGVKGNFARLIQLVSSGVPLPFGSVKNQRSFLGINNLVDFVIHCINHPNAARETLFVSDDRDLSTPDLLSLIAKAKKISLRLFPVPIPILKFAAFTTGRLREIDRLVGSLQIDINQTKELLNWIPPVSVEEGFRLIVEDV
jgi:nucleoside-diphosphate-sugar epimerase